MLCAPTQTLNEQEISAHKAHIGLLSDALNRMREELAEAQAMSADCKCPYVILVLLLCTLLINTFSVHVAAC